MAPPEDDSQPISQSPVVREAHTVAAHEHAGQRRKANGTPYIRHVVGVAETLGGAGFDDEVVAAGLLHDTVEHTALELTDIRVRFGQRIGALVEAMTDREEIEHWEERKTEHRERVRSAGREACAIYAADKLCGVSEARAGYAEIAEDVEDRLGNPLDVRMRVWQEDLRMIASLEPPLPIADMLASELGRLQDDRAATAAPSPR
jgi:hypothetical protein